MITCNLAQAGFLARLAEEYLDDIMASRALARPLVEGCLAKLMEASNEMKLGSYFTLNLNDRFAQHLPTNFCAGQGNC